jgi:hypothetical protein
MKDGKYTIEDVKKTQAKAWRASFLWGPLVSVVLVVALVSFLRGDEHWTSEPFQMMIIAAGFLAMSVFWFIIETSDRLSRAFEFQRLVWSALADVDENQMLSSVNMKHGAYWRGTVAGLLEATLRELKATREEIARRGVDEAELNCLRTNRNLAHNMALTTIQELILPIWRSHGQDFVLAPAAARAARRKVGKPILVFLVRSPGASAESVAANFNGEEGLVEDLLAQAIKAGDIPPTGMEISGALMEWGGRQRLSCVCDEARRTNPPQPGDNLLGPFHRIWTAVVGKPGYDKEPWNDCLRQLEDAIRARPDMAKTHWVNDSSDSRILNDLTNFVGMASMETFNEDSWTAIRAQVSSSATPPTPT